MTNRIIKKSHFAKSKILLIVLCILGLVFSYSCNCRNNSTAPGDGGGNGGGDITPTPTPIHFSASADSMNNHLDLYVQSDNKTNSVVIIKFKSEQNINKAKITSIKHKSGT